MPRLVNATLAALALAAFARADTIHVCGGESIQAAINNASAGDEVFVHPGTSVDCNANAVPDECDVAALDCHTNGVPDDCDIAAGTSEDCNNNGVSDECDIAILDSNANGIPDDCDIADCDGSLWCLDCIAAGGVYQGDGTDCAGDPCPIFNESDVDYVGDVDFDDLNVLLANYGM